MAWYDTEAGYRRLQYATVFAVSVAVVSVLAASLEVFRINVEQKKRRLAKLQRQEQRRRQDSNDPRSPLMEPSNLTDAYEDAENSYEDENPNQDERDANNNNNNGRDASNAFQNEFPNASFIYDSDFAERPSFLFGKPGDRFGTGQFQPELAALMRFLRLAKRNSDEYQKAYQMVEKMIDLHSVFEVARSPYVRAALLAKKWLMCQVTDSSGVRCLKRKLSPRVGRTERLKSVTVIEMLAKAEDLRPCLVRPDVLGALTDLLSFETETRTLKLAVIALFEICATSSSATQNLSELKNLLIEKHDLLKSLKRIILHEMNRDLINWAVLFAHSLSISADTQRHMIPAGFFTIFAYGLRQCFGNWTLQKVCCHALVRLLDTVSLEDAQKSLRSLAEYNIFSLISCCAKQEDQELVYWAIGLMHEFAVKDAHREELRSEGPLLEYVLHLLKPSEYSLAKVILRTFKFLSSREPEFQSYIVKLGIIQKIMPCLAGDDDDCHYWTITLLHDLIKEPEAVVAIVSSPHFKNFIEFGLSSRTVIPLYVVDIANYVACCSLITAADIVQSGFVGGIIKMCALDDVDVCCAAVLCLYNALLFGKEVAKEALRHNVLDVLSDIMLRPKKGRSEIIIAKIVYTLCDASPAEAFAATEKIFEPTLISLVVGKYHEFSRELKLPAGLNTPVTEEPSRGNTSDAPTSPKAASENNNYNYDSNADMPFCSPSYSDKEHGDDDEYELPGKPITESATALLEGALQTFRVLAQIPILRDCFVLKFPELVGPTMCTLASIMIGPILAKDFSEESLSPKEMLTAQRMRVIARKATIEALQVYARLVYTPEFRGALPAHRLFGVAALCMFELPNHYKEILSCIALMAPMFDAQELTQVGLLISAITFQLTTPTNRLGLFCAERIYHQLITRGKKHKVHFDRVRLEPKRNVDGIVFSPDFLEVWSFSSFFGTVVATDGVTESGRYMYEVEILSSGVVQVGWSASGVEFMPSVGRGVGDVDNSYSYDGMRQSVWNGFSPHWEGRTYGSKWSIGDIVGCLIDLDAGTMTYTLNGNNLGTAFTEVDPKLTWLPSISLSCNQGCRVRFGGTLDPFIYPAVEEKEYAAIPMVRKKRFFFTEQELEQALKATEIPEGILVDSENNSRELSDYDFMFPPKRNEMFDIMSPVSSASTERHSFIAIPTSNWYSANLESYTELILTWNKGDDVLVGWCDNLDNYLRLSFERSAIEFSGTLSLLENNESNPDAEKPVSASMQIEVPENSRKRVSVGLGLASRHENNEVHSLVAFMDGPGNVLALLSTPSSTWNEGKCLFVRNATVEVIDMGNHPLFKPTDSNYFLNSSEN